MTNKVLETALYQAPSSKYDSNDGIDLLLPLDMTLDILSNVLGDFFFPHIHAGHLDITKDFYSPTDTQVNCLKNRFKIYIEIDIETAPTCFGAITIIRERII